MSETMFAKAFLASIDRKPIKLSSDYISDPRKYPAQSPYTLPRPTHPFPRRERPDVASSQPQTTTVTLKPMKATWDTVTLPAQPADTTTVLDLKTLYARQTGCPVDKIKLLLNKRPCTDLKTLKDLLPHPLPATADFTLMIMGAHLPATQTPATDPNTAASSPAIELPDPTTLHPAAAAAPVPSPQDPAPLSERVEGSVPAHGPETAAAMLQSDQFWADLHDFLIQRLKNESEGERLLRLFKQAAQA